MPYFNTMRVSVHGADEQETKKILKLIAGGFITRVFSAQQLQNFRDRGIEIKFNIDGI